MTTNMGALDRTIRLIIVAVIAALYFTHRISGTLALVLEVIAVIFLLTSLVGWCAVYQLVGLSTKKGGGAPTASA